MLQRAYRRALNSSLGLGFRLTYQASPKHTLGVLAIIVTNAIAQAVSVVVFGRMVGLIPAAARGGFGSAAWHQVLLLIVAGALLGILLLVTGSVQALLGNALAIRFLEQTHRMMARACLRPKGIAHLESPAFTDEMLLAQGTPGIGYMQLPGALAQMVGGRLNGVALGVVLLGYHWWVPVLLGATLVFQYRWSMRFVANLWQPFLTVKASLRRSDYYRRLAVTAEAAKEIRVFGLASWVVRRMVGTWEESMADVWEERGRVNRQFTGPILVLVLAFGGVLVLFAMEALRGQVSLGSLAVYAGAILALAEVGWSSDADYMLNQMGLALPHLVGLEAAADSAGSTLGGTGTPDPAAPVREIRFEGVSFTYPGTERAVFEGLDLTIEAGTSLAIVGENGAGKTTLIKLLARLYDPVGGRILVDGVDLREIEPSAWRRRLAVIFQDFLRYQLPASDNVGFGSLDLAGDRQALERAAGMAGATAVIADLPRGWETILSRAYKDGSDLSGGQWQKIALARALLAAQRGGVLVLDEPTANLDVRAESELFDRFLELTRGTTTVLISHRFSSVRHADRIVVLEHGRMVEDGSHEELLARNGRYAEMFKLQAERFDLDAVPASGADSILEAPAAAAVSGEPAPAAASQEAGAKPEEAKQPLPERVSRAARTMWVIVVTAFRSAPLLAVAGIVLVPLIEASGQLVALWLKLLADSVVHHQTQLAVLAAALIAFSVGFTTLAGAFGASMRLTLTDRVNFVFTRRVAEISASLTGLEHHERPEYMDKLHLLRENRNALGRGINALIQLLSVFVSILTTAVLLATVQPILLLLPLASIPSFLATARSQKRSKAAEEEAAQFGRLATHLRDIATTATAGKELRVFCLQDEIMRRHRDALDGAYRIQMGVQRRNLLESGAASALAALALAFSTGLIAWRAVSGQGTIGDVLLAVTLAGHLGGQVEVLWVVNWLMIATRNASRFLWLTDLEKASEVVRGDQPAPAGIEHGIRFENLGFTYPGTQKTILEDVDLEIPAGSVVALVGENGAGKTTLVKLLCRFYEPTSGRILVDGRDLASISAEAWRERVSAGFQDFAKLELSLQEAVGVGDLRRVEEPVAVVAALDRAGGSEMPGRLPAGLATQLGKEWEGGVELSGGQWQKLALGRALMREEPLLLVLDEPTSALDAQTEHQLFERFSQAARSGNRRGAITVLVSHRFSTVRMADLILVVDKQRVVERGNHEELMRRRGLYAELYGLQARGYR